jgi:hypothetical protein
MEPLKHTPGSPQAVAQGCTCSPPLNRHGRGTLHGQPLFYSDRKCPVHGASTIREPKDDKDEPTRR